MQHVRGPKDPFVLCAPVGTAGPGQPHPGCVGGEGKLWGVTGSAATLTRFSSRSALHLSWDAMGELCALPSVPMQGPGFPGDAGSRSCGWRCGAAGKAGVLWPEVTSGPEARRGAGPKCLPSADAEQQVPEPGGGPASVPGWPACPQGHAEPPGGPFTWLDLAWGAVRVCALLCLSVCPYHPYLHLSDFPDARKQNPTAMKGSLELDHLGCSNPSSTLHSCWIMDKFFAVPVFPSVKWGHGLAVRLQ